MRKYFYHCIFFLMFICIASVFSEEKNANSYNTNSLLKIKLANDLAQYGYEMESPQALLEAVEILADVNIRHFDIEEHRAGTISKTTVEDNFSLSPNSIFSDALYLIGKDSTFDKWVKKIEGKLSKKKGALQGPKSIDSFIYGNDGCNSYKIPFIEGKRAQIYVKVLNEVKFDISIYDASGKIAVEGKENDIISFVPQNSKPYMIQIRNRTMANVSFSLFTD